MDAERLAALRLAKLRALAPIGDAIAHSLEFGPVLEESGHAWTLVEDRAALAGALVWAIRREVAQLDLILDGPVGDARAEVARIASSFEHPRAQVFEPGDGSLHEVLPEPLIVSAAPTVPEAVLPLLAILREHGVDPVVETDAVVGEVAGLEVARIDLRAAEPVLSVGVGAFDRELNDMLAGSTGDGPAAQLSVAAEAVRVHRRPGAGPHPLNRLRRERWLRASVIADPTLVGCVDLVAVPPLPVDGLRAPSPAPALQHGDRPCLVVCSAGVDPTLVLVASELRLHHAPEADLTLVVPNGDDYPITHDLARALRGSAAVVTLDPPWSTAG